MANETEIYLRADSEDIEDALQIIEESYNIKFLKGELKDIKTFGDLCDHVISKIQLADTGDCTTQQAFYRIRDAITNSIQIEKEQLKTDSKLSKIFPRQKRKASVLKIEDYLGFKLYALRPRHIVTNLILLLLLISLVGMLFDFAYGLTGFISSAILFRVAEWTGTEFKVDTLGQLADKVSQENYMKSRRNQTTVNRKEIVKNIERLFIEGLSLDLKEIKRETLIA